MSGPITPPLTITTVGGTPSGRPITTIKVSDGDLTISGNVATIDTSGGGAAAPADAEYLLAFDASIPTELTAARKLIVGNNVSMTHGAGANDDMIINAVTSQEGSTVNGQIQFQGTSKVFDAREVFYYDEPNGGLYVGNDTTNGDATITILADGTGEPTLSLSNPTAAVSLTCDTNQKLKVVGGVNTFVFDASSGTGGITWPDGTTQTTAASGGGDFNVNLLEDVINSGYTRYPISSQAPYGSTSVTTATYGASSTFDQPYAFPFIAPESGDVSELGVEITSAAGSSCNLEVGIYSTTSTGAPDSLLGKAVFDITTTGFKYDTSLSATATLVKSTQYWIMFVRDTSGISYGVRAVQQAFGTPTICPMDSPNPNGSCKQIKLSNSDNTLPASSITLTDFFPASDNVPCLSLKIS